MPGPLSRGKGWLERMLASGIDSITADSITVTEAPTNDTDVARHAETKDHVTETEAADAAPVQSANGETGAITVESADVPVDSVNGETGAATVETAHAPIADSAQVNTYPSESVVPDDAEQGAPVNIEDDGLYVITE